MHKPDASFLTAPPRSDPDEATVMEVDWESEALPYLLSPTVEPGASAASRDMQSTWWAIPGPVLSAGAPYFLPPTIPGSDPTVSQRCERNPQSGSGAWNAGFHLRIRVGWRCGGPSSRRWFGFAMFRDGKAAARIQLSGPVLISADLRIESTALERPQNSRSVGAPACRL